MKPLQQLFHILKFQIQVYPYRFMGILFCCFFMGLLQLPNINGLPWENHPGPAVGLFALSLGVLGMGLFSGYSKFAPGPLHVRSGSTSDPWPSSSFFWTRALDRKLIQLSQIVLYAVFGITMLLPGIAQLVQSLEPLQIRFQSPEDNSAFQQALLADPHLGANQFYDYAKRIIIELPHGMDYRIGLYLFNNLLFILLLLWVFEVPNLPERWRKIPLVILSILPLCWLNSPSLSLWLLPLCLVGFGYLVRFYNRTPRPFRPLISPYLLPAILVLMVETVGVLQFFPASNRFLEHTLPPAHIFYWDQFMIYANYHLWLWGGLALAAIFLIQSIIRKYLRPS